MRTFIFALFLALLPGSSFAFEANIAVVAWDGSNRIAKYQAYPTRAEADAHVARVMGRYPSSFSASNPGGEPKDWLVDPVTKTISFSPLPVPPPPTPADRAEDQMTTDHFMRAWVRRQAAKEGKTPRQIMDEIRSNARP